MRGLVTASEPATRQRQAPPVIDLIARQVEIRPDAVAVRDVVGGELTYRDLWDSSDAIARFLIESGVRVDDRVALVIEPSVASIAAMLGVWKAAAGYVHLSASDPDDRVGDMLATAGIDIALAGTELLDRVRRWPVRAHDLATALAYHRDPAGPLPAPRPDTLAYVIFTSGSTGRPKGVAVEHRNLAAYVDQIRPVLAPAPGDVLSVLQPMTFDASATLIYCGLVSGGLVWIVPPRHGADPGWVADHLREARVDYLKLAPSHLAALCQAGDPAALLPRKTLMIGGEATRWSWFTDLAALAAGRTVISQYGPTETTIGVCLQVGGVLAGPPPGTTPLGQPMTRVMIYLLDDALRPVAAGADGEVYIGGATVSRGYLGQPRATAATFLPDPFRGAASARMYRSGDRARARADGTLEFLGRIDDQVKIRGFRVEPGETAAVLCRHPAVADAVVVTRRAADDDRYLAAYLRARPGTTIDVASVGRFAAEALPPYLVPGTFTVLDTFPLTNHGKIDKAALPDDHHDTGHGGVPLSRTEATIAETFADVLGLDGIGRDDSFFALGGHSLLATRLVAVLADRLGRDVPLRLVFDAPTVARLATRLHGVAVAAPEATAGPVPIANRSAMPASYGQQSLWFLNQLDVTSPLYNTYVCLRALGALEAASLRAAIDALVARHEVLRSTLVLTGTGVTFDIAPPRPVRLDLLDVTDRPYPDREATARRLLTARARQGFDLTREPPLRALYVRLDHDEHIVLLSMHHVATDAHSIGVLLDEFVELYAAATESRADRLPPTDLQYPDFAFWQRSTLAHTWTDALAFWRTRLAGIPARQPLPLDRPRPAWVSVAGDQVSFLLPDGLSSRLRQLAAAEDASLFMVALAGFVTVLAQCGDDPDVVVGVPVSGRHRPELESLVGFLVNTVVIRNDAGGDPTFRELVRRVRSRSLEAFAHQELPFEMLVEELSSKRGHDDTPLINVMFAFDEQTPAPRALPQVTFASETLPDETAKFELLLYLGADGGSLTGVFQYRTELFDRSTVRRLADHLTAVLTGAAEDADVAVSRLCPAPAAVDTPAGRDDISTAYRAPTTPLEAEICLLWQQLLHRPTVGVDDDFFELGGHSLLAAHLVIRLRERFDVTIALRWCFDAPTAAGLAVLILAGALENEPAALADILDGAS